MNAQGDLQAKITGISEQLMGGGSATPQREPERDVPLESETLPEGESGELIGAEGAEGSGEGPASEEIRSIAELATALEVEPEFLYGLEFNLGEMGPDGKPVSIKLGELKDRLQGYERERGEISKQREQLTHERQQFLQQAQELLNGGQRMQQQLIDARARIQAVIAQRDSIDWGEFEKLDPGRAALERQRYDRLLQEAGQAFQQTQVQLAHHAQVFSQNYRAEQDQQLLKIVPEWRDREVAIREANAIGNWAAKTYGYSPQDLTAAVDANHRDILRKAWLYDELKAKTDTTKRQVQQAPRTLTPGRGLPAGGLQANKLKALKDRARATGKKEDQVAAGRAILDRAFANQRT